MASSGKFTSLQFASVTCKGLQWPGCVAHYYISLYDAVFYHVELPYFHYDVLHCVTWYCLHFIVFCKRYCVSHVTCDLYRKRLSMSVDRGRDRLRLLSPSPPLQREGSLERKENSTWQKSELPSAIRKKYASMLYIYAGLYIYEGGMQ